MAGGWTCALVAAIAALLYWTRTSYLAHEQAKFVPIHDVSEPIKVAVAESRKLYVDEPRFLNGHMYSTSFLHFTINVTSKIRHRADHEISVKQVEVKIFDERRSLCGRIPSIKSDPLIPALDTIQMANNRHHVDIFIRANVYLYKNRFRFNECNSSSPFTLPLTLEFKVAYRSENQDGKYIEDVLKYKERVDVRCDGAYESPRVIPAIDSKDEKKTTDAHKDQLTDDVFIPTVDTSVLVKTVIAENRAVGRFLGEPYLNFTVNMTSRLRHGLAYDIELTNVKVRIYNKDTVVGQVSSEPEHSMVPSVDNLNIEYRRHSVRLAVKSTAVLRIGDAGFYDCSFFRPFTLPLRFHFTVDVRSENENGKVVEKVIEYDENVEVCCDCEREPVMGS